MRGYGFCREYDHVGECVDAVTVHWFKLLWPAYAIAGILILYLAVRWLLDRLSSGDGDDASPDGDGVSSEGGRGSGRKVLPGANLRQLPSGDDGGQ